MKPKSDETSPDELILRSVDERIKQANDPILRRVEELCALLVIRTEMEANFKKLSKVFQDRGKNSKKTLGVLGNKTKNIQNLGKINKKVLNQSNTRSIDIL